MTSGSSKSVCGSGRGRAYGRQDGTPGWSRSISATNFWITRERPIRSPNLSFEKLDLLADDLGRFGRFDLVFGNGILHHLVLRLDDVLRALHSLSNAGGGLAFIEPNFLNPYCAFIFGTRVGRRFAKLEPDEMAFTPGQLRRALPRAGWGDVTVTTKDFLLPGLPKAAPARFSRSSRALEGRGGDRWLAQISFRFGKGLNAAPVRRRGVGVRQSVTRPIRGIIPWPGPAFAKRPVDVTAHRVERCRPSQVARRWG